MDAANDLGLYLAVWLIATGIIITVHWRRRLNGVGLVLGYVINIGLIHFAGAAVYLNNGPHFHSPEEIAVGLRESTWGLIAFGVGALVIGPLLSKTRRYAESPTSYEVAPVLPRIYLMLGAVAYVALSSFLGSIPTLTAFIGVGQHIFIAGLCLLCWKAWAEGHRRRLIALLLLAVTFPLLTMTVQGFIGFGASALAVVLLFVGSFVRPRWKVVAVAILAAYLALSVFVTYSQDRQEIREVVWGGQPMSERIEAVWLTLSELEWFNPNNSTHLDQLDNRLNQNHLVGAAVEHLGASQQYGRGDTIVQSFLALVPRAIWPEKDIEAGSGDLVTKYTGLEFAEGTSVGIGHVMEFYVNFGSLGIMVGLLLFGTIVASLDIAAGRKLAQNNWLGFTPLFLLGLAFLNVGGSLVELTSTAGASVTLALGVNLILGRLQRVRRLGASPPLPATEMQLR